MIKISVIIPTYNRKDTLKKVLQALNRQTLPSKDYEALVIDDGSTDETKKEAAKLLPNLSYPVTILSQKNKGPASARNLGISKAKGKIVLIINDDIIAASNLLKAHSDFHQKHPRENFALLGHVTWHSDLTITPFMHWLEHGGPYFSFNKIKGSYAGWERFWTCNISLKKAFLLKNGLFDTDFPYPAWEDVELGYRLKKTKLKLLYSQKALGYHHHPTTIKSIKNKMIANGKSVLILKRKIPKKYLPPLARFPQTAIFLNNIFFSKPILLLLNNLALWAERKISLGPLFGLILLHYRIEGLKISLKNK